MARGLDEELWWLPVTPRVLRDDRDATWMVVLARL